MEHPDQFGAADDLADATAYAGGCGRAGGGEEETSWARALLRRGWDLSRKAAIAGVAATAAPVVAPQIIILSIAGVALSLPFAACLASLAATDRLMAALLPPAPPQPCYYNYDLGEEESEQEEFVDAAEAADQEVPEFGHWRRETEEDAIVEEQDERFASLPLSLEPRLSQELVPLLANEEGDSAEGEFAIRNSGHALFVPKDAECKEEDGAAIEVDNEFITMEAPSPGDVSVLGVPVLRDEDNTGQRMEEDAAVQAKESVQELFVSGNENKTEDAKSTTRVQNESGKEKLSPGIDATALSNLGAPMLVDDEADNMVQRGGEGRVSFQKQGQYSHASDSGDETEQHETSEVRPLHEVNVSESPVPDDDMMIQNMLEDELAVERALQQEMRDTNPVTGEVIDVQPQVRESAELESESLEPKQQVAPELQAMTESADAYDTLRSNLTEGLAKDSDNKRAEGVEQGGVPSMMTVDDDKDLISSRSRQNVSYISDDTTRVGSKPHAGHPDQTTCVANKELGKEELAEEMCVKSEESKTMDDKVLNKDMAAQDDHISKSLVPDYQSTREDEATVEMVLEEVTSIIDPLTGEVVEVEVDIIAGEIESLPMSDLVAQDLQGMTEATEAGTVDDKTEDVTGISDTQVVDVEQQSREGSSSIVTVASVLTVDDGEDPMSSRSTPYVSTISDDMTSAEGRPDLKHRHQTTGVDYKDREFETEMLAEDKDIYTEEQLREQLDTLRAITGYRAVPSLTLEGDLAGLYIFVGVEPPHSSGSASNLMELNTKLRFLKSIIGVE